jgi:hypothetical protein
MGQLRGEGRSVGYGPTCGMCERCGATSWRKSPCVAAGSAVELDLEVLHTACVGKALRRAWRSQPRPTAGLASRTRCARATRRAAPPLDSARSAPEPYMRPFGPYPPPRKGCGRTAVSDSELASVLAGACDNTDWPSWRVTWLDDASLPVVASFQVGVRSQGRAAGTRDDETAAAVSARPAAAPVHDG